MAGPGATKIRDMTTVRNIHDGIFLCAVKVRCEDGNIKKGQEGSFVVARLGRMQDRTGSFTRVWFGRDLQGELTAKLLA